MLLTPAQIKPKSFELRRNSFFTQGRCVSCLCACLGARLLPQSYQYPNLSEGTDCIAGQLCRDKECPFSGLTKSGRVWRKVPDSDAQSLPLPWPLKVLASDTTCIPWLGAQPSHDEGEQKRWGVEQSAKWKLSDRCFHLNQHWTLAVLLLWNANKTASITIMVELPLSKVAATGNIKLQWSHNGLISDVEPSGRMHRQICGFGEGLGAHQCPWRGKTWTHNVKHSDVTSFNEVYSI